MRPFAAGSLVGGAPRAGRSCAHAHRRSPPKLAV